MHALDVKVVQPQDIQISIRGDKNVTNKSNTLQHNLSTTSKIYHLARGNLHVHKHSPVPHVKETSWTLRITTPLTLFIRTIIE